MEFQSTLTRASQEVISHYEKQQALKKRQFLSSFVGPIFTTISLALNHHHEIAQVFNNFINLF